METRQDLQKHYKHILFLKSNLNMIISVTQKKKKEKKDKGMFLFFIPTLKASFLWVWLIYMKYNCIHYPL